MLVAASSGCRLQLARGLREAGMKPEVVHIMELLREATAETNCRNA